MQVFEILDRMTLDDGNKIILYDLDENARGAEYEVPMTTKGWSYTPTNYKKYAHRDVWGISVIGKKIRISMS